MNLLRVRGYWAGLLAFFLACVCAFAQSSEFEGKRIADIQYEPAVPILDPRELAEIQLLKQNEPLHMADVAAVIDRLFATGRFEDIQVDATPSGDGVMVRFLFKLTRFIGHIEIAGKVSEPPNRAQIGNATQLNLGAPFHPEDLTTAQDNLKKLFEANGLYEYDAQSQTVDDPSAQQVLFTFRVKPGKRAKYQDPIIEGDAKLPTNTIIRATGWQVRFIHRWRQVTQALTRRGVEGVQKKYQSQDRLTATVQLATLEYDPKTRRVKPTLNVNAGPKVKVRAVEAKVSKRKLKRYIPVYDERAVDRDLLVEGARNLRDYFQNQGYYQVDVDFRELPPKNDEMVIEYVISRGERHKLALVDIEGNKYFKRDVLRERMFLEPASLQFRHGRYSEAFRQKDAEAIVNLYKGNGFRDVKVTSTVQDNYKGKPGQIAVTFHVDEGVQWKVAYFEVTGVQQVDANAFVPSLSSSEGQPFSDVNVAADRNAILSYYYSHGFPNATFEWASTPAGANQVNLKYVVKEDKRQYVRDVLISGLRHTRPGLVDKQMTIAKDQYLSPVELTTVQRRLYDLGVFARVKTAIQNPDGETQRKYVLYDFDEANRYNVNVGIGAEIARLGGTTSDLTTPAGATGFSPRVSLDVSRLNFLGLGHTVTLRSRVSNLQQRASLSYLAPRYRNMDGRNITITLLYDESKDVRTFSSKREEASIQMSRQLSKPTTALFRFTYRRVSTSNVAIPSLLVPQLLQPVRIGMMSMNLVQDRRDDPTNAHRGIYNTVDFGVATRFFGSQRSFVRGLARNSTYHRIGKKLVFAREISFGSILPFSAPAGLASVNSIPLPERFFGGGSNSHRGFPENQAGPRDIGTPAGPGGIFTQPTGFPLGGNAILFNALELRFPLIGDNISGVVFQDAGNIYRGLGDISFRFKQRDIQDFNYMVHAAGFGVRYKTPIGPIRLDLAYSVNPPKFVGFKGTIQQLLTCNPGVIPNPGSVCRGVPQRISHFQFFFSIGQRF